MSNGKLSTAYSRLLPECYMNSRCFCLFRLSVLHTSLNPSSSYPRVTDGSSETRVVGVKDPGELRVGSASTDAPNTRPIFDQNLAISQKRYKIQTYLQ